MKSKQSHANLSIQQKTLRKAPDKDIIDSPSCKHSPYKKEKTVSSSRGNSPRPKISTKKQKAVPLHGEIKKNGPYIFDPDTLESITVENRNSPLPMKLRDKDLDARLLLGELKLSRLDDRITECLENSRKVLSMTETGFLHTDGLIPIQNNRDSSSLKSDQKNQQQENNKSQGCQDLIQPNQGISYTKDQIDRENAVKENLNEKIHLARSKSCSVISEDLTLGFLKDKREIFSQKGFLSTKNMNKESNLGLKRRDFSFKDLMGTISPSMQKIKLLMPSEYDKLEEKVNSLQTIGLLSPKEFDIHSFASIKEDIGKGLEQDLKKSLKNNILITNSSNDYRTIEELRDFLSLLHNIDAKPGLHSEASNISLYDMKEGGNRHFSDQKANKNILEIEEIHLEEEKETRPSVENRKHHTPHQREQFHRTTKSQTLDKKIRKSPHVTTAETVNRKISPEKDRELTMKSTIRLNLERSDFKNKNVFENIKPVQPTKGPFKIRETRLQSPTMVDETKKHVQGSYNVRIGSQSAREKTKLFELEKEKPSEQPSRESSNENDMNLKKKNKEVLQNFIFKLLKDAERRKELLERARAAKEEEENQVISLMNQVFTNKKNKSESKVRQYIRRNRDRTGPENGSETPRIERNASSQKKIPKKVSFSIEKSPNKIKPQETPEHRHPMRASKGYKVSFDQGLKGLKAINNFCLKEDWELDLNYLKGLRVDIEKIKENIEEKIQGIEKANTTRELRSKQLTKGILKNLSSGTMKISQSTNNSLERMHERSQKSRVKTRFKNSSSRIFGYVNRKPEEVMEIEQQRLIYQPSIESFNQLPGFSVSTKNSRCQENSTPRKWSASEKTEKYPQHSKPAFMDDRKAANYVNQLILSFKDAQSLKSPRRK